MGVFMENKKRCKWCNLKNKRYVDYHDNEWGVLNFDEKYLYEMFILETFQECELIEWRKMSTAKYRVCQLETKECQSFETPLFNYVSYLAIDSKRRLWISAQNKLFSYSIDENKFSGEISLINACFNSSSCLSSSDICVFNLFLSSN